MKSRSFNLLEPSGPFQACTGFALSSHGATSQTTVFFWGKRIVKDEVECSDDLVCEGVNPSELTEEIHDKFQSKKRTWGPIFDTGTSKLLCGIDIHLIITSGDGGKVQNILRRRIEACLTFRLPLQEKNLSVFLWDLVVTLQREPW